jgi:hypothetical protein
VITLKVNTSTSIQFSGRTLLSPSSGRVDSAEVYVLIVHTADIGARFVVDVGVGVATGAAVMFASGCV